MGLAVEISKLTRVERVGRCVLSCSHGQQLEPKTFRRENHSTRRHLLKTGGPQFMKVGRGSQAAKVRARQDTAKLGRAHVNIRWSLAVSS